MVLRLQIPNKRLKIRNSEELIYNVKCFWKIKSQTKIIFWQNSCEIFVKKIYTFEKVINLFCKQFNITAFKTNWSCSYSYCSFACSGSVLNNLKKIPNNTENRSTCRIIQVSFTHISLSQIYMNKKNQKFFISSLGLMLLAPCW